MRNTVIIAEKPSVARDLARAVGAGKYGEDFSRPSSNPTTAKEKRLPMDPGKAELLLNRIRKNNAGISHSH